MARRKKQIDEQAPENNDNINNDADESFGLPEVAYEPIKRDEPEPEPESIEEVQPVEEVISEPEVETPVEPVNEVYTEEVVEDYTTTTDSTAQEEDILTQEEERYTPPQFDDYEEKSSALPKVLLILLILALIGAGIWYFGFYKPAEEKRQREAAEIARIDSLRRVKDAEEQRLRLEAEQRRADSLANLNVKPLIGTIETLNQRTNRYYVVVASALDKDLLMDHAKKLSKSGTSTFIIPPFGKTQFSRLAVDVRDSFADAQSLADELKNGEFGNDIWVVRF
jgi:hypothetical protein